MEIRQDYCGYSKLDANRKYDTCSESGQHEGPGNEKPDLEETIPPEEQGDPN